MGILLGLLTALSWGGGDFLARFATRRIGTLRTVLYMQAFGFLLLTLFLHELRSWGHLFDGSGWRPWAWGLLAGCLNAVGTFSLYRSFEIGKMSVVAPLSASYPALTVVLSLLTGERLTLARAVGIGFTLAGVMFVAGGEKAPDQGGAEAPQVKSKGLGWALCAALGFGVLFWLLGTRIVPATGPFATVWVIRLTGTLISLGILVANRLPLRQPGGKAGWQVAGIGVLDTGAFVLNNRGMQLDQVAVVSVLASLYGAVTVALAAIFLREHVSRWQWAGIVAIFAGITLISR
jgi:drug/metabolite transporter (DMT)-like permease